MRKIRMSGSVGASGEQSPEATRPGMLPLPLIVPYPFAMPVVDLPRISPMCSNTLSPTNLRFCQS